jgi:hypothetical protein
VIVLFAGLAFFAAFIAFLIAFALDLL